MLDHPAAMPVPSAPPASPELSRIASLLGIMVTVLAVACLILARAVLIPITLAGLLSFLLAPLMHLLRRLHLGRALSAVLSAVIGLSLVLALGWMIGAQIAGLAGNVPRYQATVEHKIETVRSFVTQHLADVSSRLGYPPSPPAALKGAAPPAATKKTAPPATAKPASPAKPAPAAAPRLDIAFQLAKQVLLPVASPLGTAGIVFAVSIFILLQREDLRDRLIRVFGSGDLHRTTIALDEVGRRLSQYYLALLAVNVGFGVAIASGLWAIGVPSPVLWGVLAGLLRFVPYIGSPLAALLPLALSIAVAPGWGMAVSTVLLFAGAELTISQAIEPFLYGRSTGLSPFAVVVAAIFWTWAWGPIGLLLSTPLTVCLVVIGRYVKRLEFLDILLGNRPPLSPVENFYQRLLAGDPDEVEDHAEELLRERTLAAYYDEVAIKGLQMATTDAARGVLSAEHLARVRTAMGTLVEELDEFAERKHEPRRTVGTEETATPPLVLCIAGRSPLDGNAADMLAHLLRRAGFDARPLPHAATSRGRIASLDPAGAAVVVLCYLDLTVTPTHLRFLLRRLRQRLPDRPIVLGLSPADLPAAETTRLLAATGADRVASSLRGLVEACLDLAGTPPDAAASLASVDAAD
ncbi:MAG: AI-2E family transporter [Rhodospirillales bacterium]|nr:AI-2E family transporter [Rhodospirillales bacterium]